MRIDVHAHYYPDKYLGYVSRMRKFVEPRFIEEVLREMK